MNYSFSMHDIVGLRRNVFKAWKYGYTLIEPQEINPKYLKQAKRITEEIKNEKK